HEVLLSHVRERTVPAAGPPRDRTMREWHRAAVEPDTLGSAEMCGDGRIERLEMVLSKGRAAVSTHEGSVGRTCQVSSQSTFTDRHGTSPIAQPRPPAARDAILANRPTPRNDPRMLPFWHQSV